MISIIISSANTEQLQQVTDNITGTIGVPFELIAINNSDGQRGICAVYNEGAKLAKYGTLCFMHDDINIKTPDWGKIVLNIFNTDDNIGLIGVAGSAYKTLSPSGWNPTGLKAAAYTNIIQHFKYQEKETFHYYENPGDVVLAPVTCIDGVWFCTTKAIATRILFDENTFKGFHVYDLDFSFAVGLKYKIVVTYDVLIEHFSEGNYNIGWMSDSIKLHEKWNCIFPINLGSFLQSETLPAEKETFKLFIDQLILFKFPIQIAYKALYMNNRMYKFKAKLFFKLHYTILKKYLEAYRS
jgi:hypothetical protein